MSYNSAYGYPPDPQERPQPMQPRQAPYYVPQPQYPPPVAPQPLYDAQYNPLYQPTTQPLGAPPPWGTQPPPPAAAPSPQYNGAAYTLAPPTYATARTSDVPQAAALTYATARTNDAPQAAAPVVASTSEPFTSSPSALRPSFSAVSEPSRPMAPTASLASSMPMWQDWPTPQDFDSDAFCKKLGFTETGIEQAKAEHLNITLSLCAPGEETRKEVGTGTYFYFEFVKFLAAANFILVILQIVNYSIFSAEEHPKYQNQGTPVGQRNFYHDFFISTYTDSQKHSWLAINIISIVFCFLAGPLYYGVMRWRVGSESHKANTTNGERDEAKDKMIRYIDADGTLDVSSYYRTIGDTVVRRIISVVIFCAFMAVQVLASWFVTKNEGSTNFGLSLLIAFIVAILNILYGLVAKSLTEFEKWRGYDAWKRSHTIKLLFFKLCNIITVYSAKDYVTVGKKNCTYDLIGEQMLTLLLVEIIVMNFWALVSTALNAKYVYWLADLTSSINGDEANLPSFDLATEYLEIIYRQYIATMAMIVFPLSIVLHFAGLFIEYWGDKFRLLKLCGKPQRIAATQKGFLSWNLVLIACCTLATPFAGFAWVFSGYTRDTSPLCHFP